MSHSQPLQAILDVGREALRRFLVGEDDHTTMLAKIVGAATESVPGCDMASITLMRDGRPSTPVCTDRAALTLDETQYDLGDGPCLACIRHQGVERLVIESDERWPAFNEAAAKLGVVGVLSVPLVDDDTALGGLNLYSKTTADYDDEAVELANLFADQLGIAAANAAIYAESHELSRQLQQALESRAVIEQAKGILMASQRCGPDKAFDILRRASQHQNRKLREVATEIVERYEAGEG